MKLISLALLAAGTWSGYCTAQTPPQTPGEAQTTYSAPKSRDCKKEVRNLCGRRPKGELQSCLKDGLDLNKFTDSCKAEITKSAKPSS
jgi:hypothetical protein